MTPINILVADNQPVFVDGLRGHIHQASDLQLVAVVGTGAEAVDECVDRRPDVILLDLELSQAGWSSVTHRIGESAPGVAVLAVSAHQGEQHITAAVAGGAAGYVTKSAAPEEILTAIRVVARGGFIVSASGAPAVRRRLGNSMAAGAFPQLTNRERDVLGLLMHDADTATIARSLGIAPKTVRNHVSQILVKVSAQTRAEAVRLVRAQAGDGRPAHV